MESLLMERNGDADHVLPLSALRSTTAFHTPFSPLEHGANHDPSDKMMVLFPTGPLPPLSPAPSSLDSLQVAPLSAETLYQVSQWSMVLPTLKYSTIFPSCS